MGVRLGSRAERKRFTGGAIPAKYSGSSPTGFVLSPSEAPGGPEKRRGEKAKSESGSGERTKITRISTHPPPNDLASLCGEVVCLVCTRPPRHHLARLKTGAKW
jgi:hypothetical protein